MEKFTNIFALHAVQLYTVIITLAFFELNNDRKVIISC